MVPKTVYLFCFLFCFKIVLNCECPFKAPEPPVEVPLFNDYKPEKVVINDIDYGYPFHIGGVIVLQHPVASGVQVFPHKCPAPYRPPVKEELEAIFADLVADNYTFIFSEEGFNLTTNNVILTSTKPVQEYWRWYGTKLDSTKPYEVVDLMTYWMGERLVTLCVKPDTQTQDIVIDTLGVNKNHPTTFKVDENNIKGALWKVNFEIFKTKELTQKYTDNECRLIEVWYITPGDKVLYACRAVQVGNLPYVNVPTTFSPDKITTIETGLEILVQPSIVVTPSNGPIGPKLNGGFYLFYSLKSDNHLHVREYDNEFKQVVDYDLEIEGQPLDICATEWGFGIVYMVNTVRAVKVSGYYADKTERFTTILFNSGHNPKLPTEQIMFHTDKGGLYYGTGAMYNPENAKITYGNGRFGITFGHFNNFGNGGEKMNFHQGDMIFSVDSNGDNGLILDGFSSTHSLIQSIYFDGLNFITGALGDAYPRNIKACILQPSHDGKTFDAFDKRYNRHLGKCYDLHPDKMPGNELGNSCGRMGSVVFNGETYAIAYSIKPCSYGGTLDEVGILTFNVINGEITNVKKNVIPGISAEHIVNVRSGKYGDNILIMYINARRDFDIPAAQQIGYDHDMSYVLVDFNGKVVSGPFDAPTYLMNLNDDLKFLENGSLIWTSVYKEGLLKINYLPKLK